MDASNLTTLRTFSANGNYGKIRISPDGSRIAVNNNSTSVEEYRTSDGGFVGGYSAPIVDFSYDALGLRLGALTSQSRLVLFDVSTKQVIGSTDIPGTYLSFSPDNRYLVVDGTRILDGATLALLGTTQTTTKGPPVFSMSGQSFFGTKSTNEIGFDELNLSQRSIVRRLGSEVRQTRGIVLTPDRSKVVTIGTLPDGSSVGFVVYDRLTGALLRRIAGSFSYFTVGSDGNVLVTTSNAFQKWSLYGELLATTTWTPTPISASRIGSMAVLQSGSALTVWDTTTWSALQQLYGFASPLSFSISPNGTRVAASDATGVIVTWRTDVGIMEQFIWGHSSGVNNVTWSPDGMSIISSSWDGTIRVWNAATGALVRTIVLNGTYPVKIGLLANGTKVVACCSDNTIQVYSLVNGELLQTYSGNVRSLACLDTVIEGNSFAFGCDNGDLGFADLGTYRLNRWATVQAH